MTAQINRDPFARETLFRETKTVHSATCAWCGNVRKGNKLFHYWTETDGGRKYPDSEMYCSLNCRRAYLS